VYLGKDSSETKICIYDKAVQQGVSGHWVRVELRLLGSRARKLVKLIVDVGEVVVAGVLRHYLCFKEPGQHSQRERWRTCDWWEAFLGACVRTRLCIRRQPPVSEKTMEWLVRCVAPVLADVADIEGDEAAQALFRADPTGLFWKGRHGEELVVLNGGKEARPSGKREPPAGPRRGSPRGAPPSLRSQETNRLCGVFLACPGRSAVPCSR
jgi:hypothetical protein